MTTGPDATRPSYLSLPRDEFERRVEALRDRYRACDLCAYDCDVDRTAGETGACGADDVPVVASYAPHHGEEAPLRGTRGSGTIFLSNCNLSCVFCQNYDISQEGRGRRATAEDVAEMALTLQERGCHNVNFVTPTHYAPHLVEAVKIASERGLDVPIVWNCGGYERPEILRLFDGVVDIYMPDVKWSDDELAARYSRAPGYWDVARDALREMHRQVGDLALDESGVATRGLLVRHLVMPGEVENSKRVLEFVASEISTDAYVNVMGQYRPSYLVPRNERYAAIDRRVRPDEYRAVVEHARAVGLTRLDLDARLL